MSSSPSPAKSTRAEVILEAMIIEAEIAQPGFTARLAKRIDRRRDAVVTVLHPKTNPDETVILEAQAWLAEVSIRARAKAARKLMKRRKRSAKKA